MSLAKRLEERVVYSVTCSYCGTWMSTDEPCTREVAAIAFAADGWAPHPRCVTSALCKRCAAHYPDLAALDRDIESEMPF